MSWHVLGDRRLREAEAELEQLAMDAGSAPGRIRAMHLDDEITNLWLNARSSQGTASGFSSASRGGSLVGASEPRSPGARSLLHVGATITCLIEF